MWIWEESGISLISIRSTEALYQSHLNSNNKKLLEHSHWCIATISPRRSTQILFIPLWNVNPYWREYSCLLGLVVATQLHCKFLSCCYDNVTIRNWTLPPDTAGIIASHHASKSSLKPVCLHWSVTKPVSILVFLFLCCLGSSLALTIQHKPQFRRETFFTKLICTLHEKQCLYLIRFH